MNITRLIAALAAALSSSDTAQSQTAPAEETEPDIVVTASRSGEEIPADLVGSSVTLLDAQALASRQTREVSDILRDVPGVAVSRIAGLTQVRLRGAEANHTLMLIDGIEVSDPFFGEFDFGTLLADEGARIEVLRGQQSALYGSDAIGGVIHYITPSGRESPGMRFRAEAGSFDAIAGAARVAGLSGDLDYAASATFFSTGGSPNARGGLRDLGRTNVAGSLNLLWRAASNVRLRAVGRYSYNQSDINNSDFDPASPTFGLTVDSPGSYYYNNAAYGLLRGELDLLGGRWTHGVSGQVASSRRRGFDLDTFSYGNEGRRLKASYESILRLGSGRVRHLLTFAADAEREEFRNLDPSGFAFTGTRHTDNLGFVAQYDLLLSDRLALGASLRRDENDRFQGATTYRLSGSYLLPSGTRLHAAAGSGVKNPLFYELFGFVDGRFIGNPDLRPEISEGWEAGVEQRLAGDAFLVGATYFESRLRNEIFVDFPPPFFIATPSNRTSLSRQRGIEVYGQVRIDRSWRLDASYTYLHALEAGLEEVRRPPHVASLNLGWRAPADRGGVTLTVRYNGEQTDLAFIDLSFVPLRVRLDDYTLVNLYADWNLTDRLSLFGRVENLLDEQYEEVFSFRAAGRAAFAGVRARF